MKGIARIKELTLRTRDYLVSFGECMSARIFAAYLNKIGAKARQVSLLELFWHVWDLTNKEVVTIFQSLSSFIVLEALV